MRLPPGRRQREPSTTAVAMDLLSSNRDTPRPGGTDSREGTSMTAYLIAQLPVTDPEGFEAYRQVVPPVIAAHGGRYLARGGAVSTLEGEPGGARLIVLADRMSG